MKKFKLIFLLSLTLFSILGTTSFASVTMTEEIADGILDYFAESLDAYNRTSTSDSKMTEAKTNFANVDRLKFATFFNENFDTQLAYDGDYSWYNLSVLGYWNDTSEYPTLMFFLSNNTAGSSDLDYLHLDVLYNNQVKFTGWNGTEINGSNIKYVMFQIRLSNSFNAISSNLTYGTTMYQKTNLTVENEEIIYKSLLALSPGQVVYYRPYQGTTSSKFLSNYFDADPTEPEIPENPDSGDTGESGDTGSGGIGGDTGGTITPDYSEKLENIQGSLDNIQQSIPTSGDIAGATTQGNKDFWGNEEDINQEDFENEIENEINGIMDNMSGEISQNQIFGALQDAENGFLNFFKEEQEEGFYDLAFSWEDIKLYDTVLIPAGGINISQMCREIESLGYIQTLIRTITCFSVCILLVKQIYNLVLSTLGIDNPYLYEDGTETTNINAETGEYTKFYTKRKRQL